jgi:SRSO17 transposase
MSNGGTEENLGKIENGIVAVTAYGLLEGITFPLIFEVY